MLVIALLVTWAAMAWFCGPIAATIFFVLLTCAGVWPVGAITLMVACLGVGYVQKHGISEVKERLAAGIEAAKERAEQANDA